MTYGRQNKGSFFSAGHLLDCALNAAYAFIVMFTVCTFVHIPSFSLGFHPPMDKTSLNTLIMIACGVSVSWHIILLAFAEPAQEPQKPRVVWTPGNRV